MEPIILVSLILTAIRKAPDNTAPSGLLYAGLMGHVSLDEFNAAVSVCCDVGLMTRGHSHLLMLTALGIEKADAIERATA